MQIVEGGTHLLLDQGWRRIDMLLEVIGLVTDHEKSKPRGTDRKGHKSVVK